MSSHEQGDAAGLHGDAAVLRAAARVMRRRSRNPHGFWLGVFCSALENWAGKLDAQAAAADSEWGWWKRVADLRKQAEP